MSDESCRVWRFRPCCPSLPTDVSAGAWAGTPGRGRARPSGRLGVGSRPKVPVRGAKSASPPSTAPTVGSLVSLRSAIPIRALPPPLSAPSARRSGAPRAADRWRYWLHTPGMARAASGRGLLRDGAPEGRQLSSGSTRMQFRTTWGKESETCLVV